jgi:hypothetical protein
MVRFEARWVEEEGCEELVKNAWELNTRVLQDDVVGGLKGVMKDLVDWSQNVLGDLDKRISKLKKELEECRRRDIDDAQVRREELLCFKLR